VLDPLKAAHALLAILAVGTNVSFPLWIRLAERDGSALAFTLTTVRSVDKWVTIPSYALAAVTGIALTAAEGIPFTAAWIWGSIVLFVVLMVIGFGPYRPLSRRRLALAARGPRDAAYRAVDRRIDLLDGAIIGSALVITVLMLARPQ
jgi:uncharacterized membrane protein